MNTTYIELHDVFSAIAEKTRLRIILLLSVSELCVCDLTTALNLPQSTISRHMSRLKLAGLVTDRRTGKWVHYSLNRGSGGFAEGLFNLMEFAKDQEPYKNDRERLIKYQSTEDCCS